MRSSSLTEDDHAISAITMWEIAMLSHRNRIRLDAPPLEWIENAVTSRSFDRQLRDSTSRTARDGRWRHPALGPRRNDLVSYAPTATRANIPGVYAVIRPVNAEAATVNGEASQSLPGPLRPL